MNLPWSEKKFSIIYGQQKDDKSPWSSQKLRTFCLDDKKGKYHGLARGGSFRRTQHHENPSKQAENG